MKTVFTLLIGTILTTSLFAQKQVKLDNDFVKIESIRQDCSDKKNGIYIQYELLTITNKTANSVTLDYINEAWYNGKCTACDLTVDQRKEHQHSVTIPANSSVSGSCEVKDSGLRVYVKHLDFESESVLEKLDIKIINTNLQGQ